MRRLELVGLICLPLLGRAHKLSINEFVIIVAPLQFDQLQLIVFPIIVSIGNVLNFPFLSLRLRDNVLLQRLLMVPHFGRDRLGFYRLVGDRHSLHTLYSHI